DQPVRALGGRAVQAPDDLVVGAADAQRHTVDEEFPLARHGLRDLADLHRSGFSGDHRQSAHAVFLTGRSAVAGPAGSPPPLPSGPLPGRRTRKDGSAISAPWPASRAGAATTPTAATAPRPAG